MSLRMRARFRKSETLPCITRKYLNMVAIANQSETAERVPDMSPEPPAMWGCESTPPVHTRDHFLSTLTPVSQGMQTRTHARLWRLHSEEFRLPVAVVGSAVNGSGEHEVVIWSNILASV